MTTPTQETARSGQSHTPGPWQVVRLDGRTSYRLWNPETTSELMAQANARLISAAPELLEACKVAFEALHDMKQSGDDRDWEAYHFLHEAYAKTQAAITKATGGQV